MASSGKVEVEVEVKSSADKFWVAFRDLTSLFPKVLPNDFKSIEILEGDGKAVGSIFLMTFGEEFQLAKTAKMKIEVFDDANREISYLAIGGDLLEQLKHYQEYLIVTQKGDDGSLAKWSCEYEKANQEDPEPSNSLKPFAVNIIQTVDHYVLNSDI